MKNSTPHYVFLNPHMFCWWQSTSFQSFFVLLNIFLFLVRHFTTTILVLATLHYYYIAIFAINSNHHQQISHFSHSAICCAYEH